MRHLWLVRSAASVRVQQESIGRFSQRPNKPQYDTHPMAPRSDESPVPFPTPLAMSTISSEPTPSPVPIRALSPKSPTSPTTSRPHPKHNFPTPTLRLEIKDLNHHGANVFTSNNNISTALAAAVETVLSALYKPTVTNSHIPPTRSVTLILRSMEGVAYTASSSLDDDHKEIHFSLDYIANIPSKPRQRQRDEIQGVLVHEMVHCWQWNALGTAPGGLIEGIADFVRLKAGLGPPHWKKKSGGDWDAGYECTAYFLEWLEDNWGAGSVIALNNSLKDEKYVESKFWKKLFGKNVDMLWEDYELSLKKPDSHDDKSAEASDQEHEEVVLVEREVDSKGNMWAG